MESSIQEYCKKINRQITFVDIGSVFITFIFLSILAFYIHTKKMEAQKEVIYSQASGESEELEVAHKNDIRPFGSKSGKTYTFSWCQGSTRILEKNKIYFTSGGQAEASGRTLSKLCKK